ncbi:MAG: hypothetical protein CVT60_02860 [Actinobacteria bacterium HGW-Actinobacteria-10]|nr:MAG: hypothetical protein CVT60_02860 [Actinobacteria bacterium HGW-Actinobacteria-10]
MSATPLRTLITIVMNVLVAIAVAVTIGLIIRFFGSLSSTEWGQAVVKLTDVATLPAGVADVKTPYGGYFDVNGAITVGATLLAEWILSVFRSRA